MIPRDRFAILPTGEIRINDRSLIDLVREVELPFAQEEYNERNTLARISLTETTVTWSDFQQFHRDWWTYNLGSFIFARQDYELQLRGTF